MNCHTIFYLAKKTSLCEKTLKKELEAVEFKSTKTFFATTPQQLGENLISSLAETNMVITVGGLFSADNQGIEKVLSKALSHNPPQDVKKLRNKLSDYDGYIIRQDCQVILVLPDEPDEISDIFSGPLKEYLQKFSQIQN